MCRDCEIKALDHKGEVDVDLTLLDSAFKEYESQGGNLISILQKTQEIYGYLPIRALERISERTGIKKAKIYGIATFYAQFRMEPLGKYVILQCQGTACYVNGSREISDAICEELGIAPGGTTSDGLFTLENVACLGCCSLSPVMMINDETYGKLTPDTVKKIIRDIYNKENGVK